LDGVADKILWIVGGLAQIAGWSALIWWDHDLRQKFRFSRWSTNPVLGVPFSIIYGIGYVLAFLIVPTITSLLVVGVVMLGFMAFGVEFSF